MVRIIQLITPGGVLLRAWQLTGGISARMTAFEVAFPDGSKQKMILRQPGAAALSHNPRIALHEYQTLQLVHTLGLPVPKPIYFAESGDLISTSGLVMEYLEGQPEFSPPDIDAFAYQLALQLVRIHTVNLSSCAIPSLPQPPVRLTDILGEDPQRSDQALPSGQVRRALSSFQQLPGQNPPVLRHGDYWQGNVLWQDGKLVAIVDWEDACLGDPLIDLAISRLDILWINGVEAMHAFTCNYHSMLPIDYTHLPFWDLCAALRLARLVGADLAGWAAFFLPYGRSDITEHTIRAHYDFFIAQALEKL